MGSLGKLKGIRKCKNCGIDVKIYHYDVHHKDENKLNNSKENLQIMTRSEHISYHSKKRKKNK